MKVPSPRTAARRMSPRPFHGARQIGGKESTRSAASELLGRHPGGASFFAHLPTFLRTYPLPAPAGDNYLVPPFSRFSGSTGIRRHYTPHLTLPLLCRSHTKPDWLALLGQRGHQRVDDSVYRALGRRHALRADYALSEVSGRT